VKSTFAREEIRQRDRQVDGLAGGIERGDERGVRAVDDAAHRLHAPGFRDRLDVRHQAGIGLRAAAHDPQQAIGVDFVLEAAQHAVKRPDQDVRLRGAHFPDIEDRGGARHQRRGVGGADIVRPQDRRQRGARGDPRRDERGVRRERDVAPQRLRRRRRRGGPRRADACRHDGRHDQQRKESGAR
jgi:hypothetical protein